MQKILTKTPKLRFPEFRDEWRGVKLKDVVELSKEKYDPLTSTSNFPDIELESLESESGALIRVFDSKDQKSLKTKFKKGEILFGKLRPYLKKYLQAPYDGVCSTEIWDMKGMGIDNDLLRYIVQIDNFTEAVNISSGSKMPRSDWSVVGKRNAFLPMDRSEQQKIIDFLTAVDEKIMAIQSKIDLLKKYKKGVMQAIFSQKLRFKGGDGKDFPDWEERKFGEIAEFSKGGNISKSDVVSNGMTEAILYGELYTHYKEVIDEVYLKTNLNPKKLFLSERNDVIIPASGETSLDIARASCLLRVGIGIGGDINVIRTKQNGIFLAYYLSNHRNREIAQLSQGNSVVHLYSSQLKKLFVTLPILEEQQKIADFLMGLDDIIELESKKLGQAKRFKKALLQQMFI